MSGGRASAAFGDGQDQAWCMVAWVITRMRDQGATDSGIIDALTDAAELHLTLGLPDAASELAGGGEDGP